MSSIFEIDSPNGVYPKPFDPNQVRRLTTPFSPDEMDGVVRTRVPVWEHWLKPGVADALVSTGEAKYKAPWLYRQATGETQNAGYLQTQYGTLIFATEADTEIFDKLPTDVAGMSVWSPDFFDVAVNLMPIADIAEQENPYLPFFVNWISPNNTWIGIIAGVAGDPVTIQTLQIWTCSFTASVMAAVVKFVDPLLSVDLRMRCSLVWNVEEFCWTRRWQFAYWETLGTPHWEFIHQIYESPNVLMTGDANTDPWPSGELNYNTDVMDPFGPRQDQQRIEFGVSNDNRGGGPQGGGAVVFTDFRWIAPTEELAVPVIV